MTVTKEIVNEEIAIYQPVCKACCRFPFYPLYLLVTSEVILPVTALQVVSMDLS